MESATTLFFCGDVMTGRGIDQILPHRSDPTLHEPHVADAIEYVHLAEQANGRIERPVAFDYIWGDALEALRQARPAMRVINLETSITTSDAHARDKAIHYRMHPGNVTAITAAGIDCCVLANNHVLDWGRSGLLQTLDTLEGAGIAVAGAGRDAAHARLPAARNMVGNRRAAVFAYAHSSSGARRAWAAGPNMPGINHLNDLSDDAADMIAEHVRRYGREGDMVIVSIHWGGNWGWSIDDEQVAFAHRLIDEAGADIVHGHSSHHVKGLEVYRDRLILYGCGDLLTDYEGIGGHEAYRPQLSLMYFPRIDLATRRVVELRMTPMRLRRMRLQRADDAETHWLRDTMSRECERFGVRITLEDGGLTAAWK